MLIATEETIRRAVEFHGHLGPFLVIGVRIGLAGLKELGAQGTREPLSITASLPLRIPFSCIVDGIQVSTRCTVGNRRLALVDSETIQIEFGSGESGQRVVVRPKDSFLAELERELQGGIPDMRLRQVASEVAAMPESKLLFVKRQRPGCDLPPVRRRVKLSDLGTAKQRMRERKLSLVFVKNSQVIFETNDEGLRGFLRAVDSIGDSLSGASVADKIVGRAAAFLCVHSRMKAVFAVTMSQAGRKILEAYGIPFQFEEMVSTILNRNKSGKCPFEILVENTREPEEAFERIRRQCT